MGSRRLRPAFLATFAAGVSLATGLSGCAENHAASNPPPPVPQGVKAPSMPVATAEPHLSGPPGVCLELGKACAPDGILCGERPGCGPNGYRCEQGAWRAMFTSCNPPPPTRGAP